MNASIHGHAEQDGRSGLASGPAHAAFVPLTNVLIIEDDPDIVHLLTMTFGKAGGFKVTSAEDGSSGLEKARDQLPNIVILDLALPRLPGLEICKILKTHQQTRYLPILVLTAKAETVDRIVALEMGADDYVTKPFSPREVLLRVKAILRRQNREIKDEPSTIGDISIHPSHQSVSVSGKAIQLTLVEFKLLKHLMHRCGRVESRDRLLIEVWGYEHAVETRTVDTHIQRLRKKLGAAGKSIETIRGFGYRFRER